MGHRQPSNILSQNIKNTGVEIRHFLRKPLKLRISISFLKLCIVIYKLFMKLMNYVTHRLDETCMK